MANTKISEATLSYPARTDKIPIARVGDTAARYVKTEGISGGVLNVLNYGAVGDGTTDDTAAFTAVVAALTSNGGGSVYIPSGTYKCTSTITWPYGSGSIKIYGDGAKSVIYYSAVDGSHCWVIPQWDIDGTEKARFIIRDLAMRGAGKLSATGSAIQIRNTWEVTIDSLSINTFGGGAAVLNQGGQNVGIYRCFFHENGYGVHLRDTGTTPAGDTYNLNSNNVSMRDCQMQHSVSHGVYIEKPSGLTAPIQTVIDNCIIQGNGGAGVYAEDFNFLRLQNIYFETNQTADATLGDIHFEKGYYCIIEHCEDHWTGSSNAIVAKDTNTVDYGINAMSGTITLDSNCVYWTFFRMPSDLVNNGYYSIYHMKTIDTRFTDGDTTPTVFGNTYFFTANTGATSITTFDNGQTFQHIYIYFEDAVTTLVHSTSLRLSGATNWNPAIGSTIHLVKYPTYNWVEVGRMNPA